MSRTYKFLSSLTINSLSVNPMTTHTTSTKSPRSRRSLSKFYRRTVQLTASLLFLPLSLTPLTALAGDYDSRHELNALIQELKEKHNFKEQELINVFSDAKHKESIIKAMTRPAEKVKSWGEYRDIFITKNSIRKGVEFWNQHQADIKAASDCYGIPPEIIVGIIGVETRYGQNKGSYRVIDALSTLAFDYPPRSKFFYKELREFIILADEVGLDPLTVKGSYAGAMGFPQFIPSSYRNYAIDFDKNGKTDLVNSPIDAIGSVANYFNVHGWITGKEVLLSAKPSSTADASSKSNTSKANNPQSGLDLSDIANNSLSPNVTLDEIEARGLQIENRDLSDEKKGVLMELKGKQGTEHWVGLHNFYVITRYNHSRLYAMAVYQLGQEIKANM